MKRIPVESSMIASLGYDEAKRILEIGFNSRVVAQLIHNILGEMHHSGTIDWVKLHSCATTLVGASTGMRMCLLGLMNAESHGCYFLAHIRDVYDYWPVR